MPDKIRKIRQNKAEAYQRRRNLSTNTESSEHDSTLSTTRRGRPPKRGRLSDTGSPVTSSSTQVQQENSAEQSTSLTVQIDQEPLDAIDIVPDAVDALEHGRGQVPMPPPDFVPRRSTRIRRAPEQFIPDASAVSQNWPKAASITKYCRTRTHKGLGCAALSAEHHPEYYNSLQPNKKNDITLHHCIHQTCRAVMLKGESSSKCCADGKVALGEKFADYSRRPPLYLALMAEGDSNSIHLMTNAKKYNDEFAFGTLSTESGPLPAGMKVIKVNGQMKYQLSGIHPRSDNSDPAKPFRPLAQTFCLNAGDAARERIDRNPKLKEPILRQLHDLLAEINDLAKLYKTSKEIYDEAKAAAEANGRQMDRFRIRFLDKRNAKEYGVRNLEEIRAGRCQLPTELGLQQLALVYFDPTNPDVDVNLPVSEEKGICLTGKTNERISMPWWSRIADPAFFPLLFPYGQFGYELGIPLNIGALDGDPDGGEGEQLFMEGEKKSRKFVSRTQYWRYMLQLRHPTKEQCDWKQDHWLWSWRGQLTQLFICSLSNRIDAQKYQESRKAQRCLKSALPQALIDALALRAETLGASQLGRVFFANEHIRGSRRFYQRAYADVMAICRRFGNPHLFITYTMSPKAPEYDWMLGPKQGWQDRPDVVGRLFMNKVKELEEDIVVHKIMGPTAAWFFSVEHQNRGLPHIHMCVTLRFANNMPIGWDKDAWNGMTLSPEEYIAEYICAELPEWPKANDRTNAAEMQRTYCRLVDELMYHTCSKDYCQAEGECEKRFPKPYCDRNIVSDESYPMYRRRPPAPSEEARSVDPDRYGHKHVIEKRAVWVELNNQYVVPHNKFLLCKFLSHINVEWLEGDACIKYVLKYITKGVSLAFAGVQDANRVGELDYDEFEEIKRARYMTANEAFLSIYGYPIVHKCVGVDVLYVHEPSKTRVVYEEEDEEEVAHRETENAAQGIEKVTPLTAYFTLNSSLSLEERTKYRYDTILEAYYFDKTKKAWKKREKKVDRLVRIGSASAGNRECQAIRAILLTVAGPTGWDFLKTVEGHYYPTFWEAAVARGLCADDQIWSDTVREAIMVERSLSKRIRWMAIFLGNVKPSDPLRLLEENMPFLINERSPVPVAQQKKRLFLRIEFILRRNGTHPSGEKSASEQIGLPRPEGLEEIADEEWITEEYFPGTMFGDWADEADDRSGQPRAGFSRYKRDYDAQLSKCNQRQKDFVSKVMRTVQRIRDAKRANSSFGHIQRLFYLTGDGGTGKTFTYNTLIAGLKSSKVRVQVTASTGIAATLLIDGMTLHMKLRINNDVESDTLPTVDYESPFAEVLRQCEVLVVDEVSMMDRKVLEYVDRVLRSVEGRSPAAQLPFGGKVVVLGGDWKQLMPVIPGGNDYAQFCASVKNSEFFKGFETFRLIENMRQTQAAVEYSRKLKVLGTGASIAENGCVTVDEEMCEKDLDSLVEFVFPHDELAKLADPQNCAERLAGSAILCPLNKETLAVNDKILAKIPGELKKYDSFDRAIQNSGLDILAVNVADRDLENIFRKTPSGLPPHHLPLKVGAIVMVIRNISVSDGLCNGTRVRVVEMMENTLVCEHISGHRKGKRFGLYRYKFTYGGEVKNNLDSEGGVKFERIQFPIRPGFVMTINKSQGQTLDRVGLMLRNVAGGSSQCFSHGQLYVAFSRVRRQCDIKMVVGEQRDAKNVVFQQILDREEIEEGNTIWNSTNI